MLGEARLRRIAGVYDQRDILWLIGIAETAAMLLDSANELLQQVPTTFASSVCAQRVALLRKILRQEDPCA